MASPIHPEQVPADICGPAIDTYLDGHPAGIRAAVAAAVTAARDGIATHVDAVAGRYPEGSAERAAVLATAGSVRDWPARENSLV